MNVNGPGPEAQAVNVVPLFGNLEMENLPDPITELLLEGEVETSAREIPLRAERIIVSEDQFADEALFTLDRQLAQLKESMNRIKFYLSDLDDLLPK